jgi:hypothetical protein
MYVLSGNRAGVHEYFSLGKDAGKSEYLDVFFLVKPDSGCVA